MLRCVHYRHAGATAPVSSAGRTRTNREPERPSGREGPDDQLYVLPTDRTRLIFEIHRAIDATRDVPTWNEACIDIASHAHFALSFTLGAIDLLCATLLLRGCLLFITARTDDHRLLLKPLSDVLLEALQAGRWRGDFCSPYGVAGMIDVYLIETQALVIADL